MSLRAIRKRENQLTPSSTQTRKTLYKKQTILPTTPQQNKATKLRINGTTANEGQSLQFGRRAHSNPELRTCGTKLANDKTLIRTKSANDIHTLLKDNNRNNNNNNKRPGEPHTNLINAKSEVCLQTIATHSYVDNNHKASTKMMRGGQVNRELSQSTYGLSTTGSTPPGITVTAIGHGHRRMSECSSSDAYSQRTSSISASDLTLSSPTPMPRADANTVLRVPIIGYEVMEERARFTVYKLRVENPITNDCWLVLRRYTDFVRLNTKLKQAFPYINLMLPRKKLFGDNFNSVFLDNRVQGLQIFVNSIMAKDELRRSEQVREFFCLDEPPSYSESMEECRAIFEAQEETIAHLKMQIQSKNELILSLQQKVREEIQEKEQLRQALRNMALPRNNNQ